MILESVRVENFKCIDDSTEFTVRSLTALVGKNESGKTALLKALYRVNPILPVRGQLPRHRIPAAPVGGLPAAPAVGARPRRHHHVAARGRRHGRRGRRCWARTRCPATRVVRHAAATTTGCAGRSTSTSGGSSPTWCAAPSSTRDELRSLWAAATVARARPDAPGPRGAHARPGGPAASTSQRALPAAAPSTSRWRRCSRRGCRGSSTSPSTTACPAEVSIDELMRRKASDQLTVVDTIFLALLELANTTPEDLQQIDQFEYLVAELEAVSQRITRDVLEYLEPGPVAGGRFPLRRRAPARPAALQHRLRHADAHPQPAPQRSRWASTSAAPASSGSSRSSSGCRTSGATTAPTTSSCSTSPASASTPARRWT